MGVAVTVATAPTLEIGYAQQTVSNWWLYDPNETTPELQWPMSVYVYDQMRRQDAQVTSVLRAVTLPVRRTPWRIDPNGARDEVVQFIADDLGLPIIGQNPEPPPRSKDRFSWPEHLRQALLMLPFGHMFFEIVFRVTPDGSRAHLRKLAPRMPRTIERIDVADDGGLISISQYWMRTTQKPQPIPVDRLVAYVHELEGGNWLGTSILRPAYKNWLLKDRLLRVQAQTIERNGMGIPLYKAQDGATPDDMAKGLAMATAWRAGDAAGSATPFGADLVLRGVEGTLPDAEPAIRYHDEQIARAVLAHFLNLGTQTGSWALGTTFADFFTLSLQTLAQQIADTATCHIVEDVVDINFGPDEPAPRVTFDEIGSRQAATAAAIKTLVDAGVIRPDEVLEESSRQQYGLPPADPSTVRQPPAANAPDPNAGAAQDLFGPNSVAAAAGDADPKDAAAAAADDDEPLDDETWALVVAFAELTGQVLAAEWNPKLHLRDNHGKFRTMVDRIAGTLVKWRAGGEHGDPLAGEFNREQLRRAAVKVGLNPKHGATFDEIKNLFYDRARKAGGGTSDKPDVFAEFRAMTPNDARDALDLKKVDELKPMLREAGLPVSGRKRDLVDRLVKHVHGDGANKPNVPKKPSTAADIEGGDFSGLTRVGEQTGFNEGGLFKADDGSLWYVKSQQSLKHAQNEKLAASLYQATGLEAPSVVIGKGTPDLSGEVHTATKYLDGAKPYLKRIFDGRDQPKNDAFMHDVRSGFAVDAWLANWDTIGENPAQGKGWDNIVSVKGPHGDLKPARIDSGGALLFRGTGGPKGDAFGPVVTEWDKFRDPTSDRRSSQVFRETTHEELAASVAKVQSVTPAKIRELVKQSGMDKSVADMLIKRRADVISRMKAEKKPWGTGATTGNDALAAAPVSLRTLFMDESQAASAAYNALNGYQDGGYRRINKDLLDAKGGSIPKSSASDVRDIDRAMNRSKLTHDVIVYRGERNPSRNFAPGVWSPTGGMEGMEWTFHAYASTSTSQGPVKGFVKLPPGASAEHGAHAAQVQATIMKILVPKGTKAIDMENGSNIGERELLLARGLRYRVVKDRGVNKAGIRELDVEVVTK